jgi:putative oligomerization/nucleic acid binding protein
MAFKERPVAAFAPSLRTIKLYQDGRIEYQGKSGSVIGARAYIAASGTKRRFRDTRVVLLMIEGPRVAISAPLPVNGVQLHKQAQIFASQVNDIATQLGGSPSPPEPPPASPPPASPPPAPRAKPSQRAESPPKPSPQSTPPTTDLLDQLERLGRLRDSGVLSEDEFQAQKAALLRPPSEA